MPFDRDFKEATQKMNLYVRGLDETIDFAGLDRLFSDAFGEVKSVRISQTIPKSQDPLKPGAPKSLGYGYVCFNKVEDFKKALDAATINGIEIKQFVPRNDRLEESKRKTAGPSNLFIKNFNPSWDIEKIKEVFSRYGEIKTCGLFMKPSPKDKVERPIAFVFFKKDDDPLHGPQAA
jgi:RNA recognition motif-containing protein